MSVDEKILDAHVHVFGKGTQGVRDLLQLERQFGYAACNFLSCECMGDAVQNALGIYLKAIAPENYAFGGLTYRYDYSFREELEKLMEIGFDGMKMVEDKPTLRKELGIPFNDRRYNEFYRALEEKGIPLLAHVADPEEFWDQNLIPIWAEQAGYFYGDGTYPEKEKLYAEVEDVLSRFPGLHIILAHMYFMSADLERLDRLMERYSNVALDIVAGTEMYWNFGKRAADWRKFFLKYQDRIVYGTDNCNVYDQTEIENMTITNRLEQSFLKECGPVYAWDKQTQGIDLPESVRKKIFGDNFRRLTGDAPRKLNRKAAAEYLSERLRNPEMKLSDYEKDVLSDVLCEIQKTV